MSGILQMVANNVAPAIPIPTVYLDAVDYVGSGTTWDAQNGTDATLVNTPTFAAPAPTYFSFAPASLEAATLPALSSLDTWTIEAWFRVTATLTGQITAVLCDQFNLTNALNFSMGTNNAPTDYLVRIGFFNGAWRNTAGFAPTLNTWYHMVGTYDGTTMKEYVDGTLTSSASSLGTSSSGGVGLRVARRWDEAASSTNYFPGDIGLTRIWNSALTAAQVQELYNDNVTRFSNSVVTANLVAYWDPDLVASYPGTGTTINNLTATSLPGTMSNITYTDPYFAYNGTSSTVSIADDAVLEPGSGDFTVEAWVYYSVIAGSSRIVLGKTDSGLASGWGYGIRTASNGSTYMEVGNGTTSVTSPTYTVSTGQWYQIVGVWTNVAANTIELYINGASQGSNSHAFASIKDTANPLYLGSFDGGGVFGQWLNGRIGVTRLYNSALTSAQVLQNFNADRSKYGI